MTVFEKGGYRGVTADCLDHLQRNRIEVAFVAGIDTDCCVLKTAIDLFEDGIRPVVLAHYCASTGGGDSHAAGLKVLSRLIGTRNLLNDSLTPQVVEEICQPRPSLPKRSSPD